MLARYISVGSLSQRELKQILELLKDNNPIPSDLATLVFGRRLVDYKLIPTVVSLALWVGKAEFNAELFRFKACGMSLSELRKHFQVAYGNQSGVEGPVGFLFKGAVLIQFENNDKQAIARLYVRDGPKLTGFELQLGEKPQAVVLQQEQEVPQAVEVSPVEELEASPPISTPEVQTEVQETLDEPESAIVPDLPKKEDPLPADPPDLYPDTEGLPDPVEEEDALIDDSVPMAEEPTEAVLVEIEQEAQQVSQEKRLKAERRRHRAARKAVEPVSPEKGKRKKNARELATEGRVVVPVTRLMEGHQSTGSGQRISGKSLTHPRSYQGMDEFITMLKGRLSYAEEMVTKDREVVDHGVLTTALAILHHCILMRMGQYSRHEKAVRYDQYVRVCTEIQMSLLQCHSLARLCNGDSPIVAQQIVATLAGDEQAETWKFDLGQISAKALGETLVFISQCIVHVR